MGSRSCARNGSRRDSKAMSLWDKRPCLSVNYFRNMLLASMKKFRQFYAGYSRRKQSSYLLDLFRGILRLIGTRLSACGIPTGALQSTTVLVPRVLLIVGISSKKQVIRSNAPRIVASVEHPESSWNISMMKFPRYSVGTDMTKSVIFEDAYLPVPLTERSSPLPAIRSFVHIPPKSHVERFSTMGTPNPRMSIGTFTRAISSYGAESGEYALAS